MSAEVVDHQTRQRVHEQITKFMTGRWLQVSADELTIRRIEGGMSNNIYYCSEPEGDEVLVRFYGEVNLVGKEAMGTNEASEVISSYVIGENGLGPKIYGVFPGGRIEQYFKSKMIQDIDYTDEELNTMIARRLARFHSLTPPLTRNKEHLLKTTEMLYKGVEALGPDVLNSFTISFADEWKFISDHLTRLKSGMAFCHMDLNTKNILLRDSRSGTDADIVFVDFDNSGYLYASADIGNYFAFWEINTSDPNGESKSGFPSEKQRRHFVTKYLEERKAIKGGLVEEHDDVEFVLAEAAFYSLFMNLLLLMWAISKLTGAKSYENVDLNRLATKYERRYMEHKKNFVASGKSKMICYNFDC